jgi:putative DNA-invertase from lambdoid prophage Rac
MFGRPAKLDPAQRAVVRAALAAGVSVSELARRHGVSRQTVMRARADGIDAELATPAASRG